VNNIVEELKSVDTGFGTAPRTLHPFTADITLDVTNNCSLRHLQRWYIFTIYPSLLSDAGLWSAALDCHDYLKVFPIMSSQCLVLPELFYAAMINKGPRTPPLKNENAFLSDTVELHGSLDLSLYYGSDVILSDVATIHLSSMLACLRHLPFEEVST
jgi:hypothetical protein